MTEQETGGEGREESPRPSYAEERIRPEDIQTKNPALAHVACIVGAIAGALVWAGIVYSVNREIGWVAWGIGGLVGGLCGFVGGRGKQMAITAAIFAFASIAIGKVFAVQWMVTAFFSSPEMRRHYDEERADIDAFAQLGDTPTDDQIETFIMERGIDQTVEEFRANSEAFLREGAANPMTFEEWGEEAASQVNVFEAVSNGLGPLDLLFAGLGVATAFGIVMRMSQSEATRIQLLRRQKRRMADATDDEDASSAE